MGSDNFFSKVASVDPLAQALHLPGSNKYAQAVAQRNAGATDTNGGAYTGIAPTLAAANAGYVPGGPGAPAGWTQQNSGSSPGGLFGFGMRNAGTVGRASLDTLAATGDPGFTGLAAYGNTTPSYGGTTPVYGRTSGVSPAVNPYVQAARGAQQQGNQNGY